MIAYTRNVRPLKSQVATQRPLPSKLSSTDALSSRHATSTEALHVVAISNVAYRVVAARRTLNEDILKAAMIDIVISMMRALGRNMPTCHRITGLLS